MENNELVNIWGEIDSEINLKSKDELNQLLTEKTKKTINKFLYIVAVSVIICVGLILFLIITALNRNGDIPYQLNNLTLGLITVIALISSLYSWYRLQNNKYNRPLKIWLEERIDLLSRWLTGRNSKLYLFLVPIFYILTVLSIHVYFENKLFVEVIKTEESIIGLIVGAFIGLFVSYYVAGKIRKHHLINLEFLKSLYDRLSKPQDGLR